MSDLLALFNKGKLNEADAQARQRLRANPKDPDALHIAGAVAIRQRHWEEGVNLLEQAVASRPDDANILCNLGTARRSMGEFEQARQLYNRGLEIAPEYARAYFYLSQIDRYSDDELLQSILSLLNRQNLSDEDRSHLHFAAGKILDDLKRWNEAFYHYSLGNAACPVSYDPYDFARQVDSIIEVFTPDFLRSLSECGHTSSRPIFLIGMPRSGTTLAERILARNTEVFAAGELPDIPSIAGAFTKYNPQQRGFPHSILNVTNKAFSGFADAYLKRLDQVDTAGHRFVVDKNPSNFLYAGLIHLMFPKAAVVHCRRSAINTCISCFFQRFASGHEYSFDLTHLGTYYHQYDRLMSHWKATLPEKMFDLDHEQLVQSPETVTDELLDFCHLAWDSRCLEPHEADTPVATASAWQVRQPISSSNLDRYAGYEPFIGPLRNALASAEE